MQGLPFSPRDKGQKGAHREDGRHSLNTKAGDRQRLSSVEKRQAPYNRSEHICQNQHEVKSEAFDRAAGLASVQLLRALSMMIAGCL